MTSLTGPACSLILLIRRPRIALRAFIRAIRESLHEKIYGILYSAENSSKTCKVFHFHPFNGQRTAELGEELWIKARNII